MRCVAEQDHEDPYSTTLSKEDFAPVQLDRQQRLETCRKWRDEYHVSPGRSWGLLSEEKQYEWQSYSCDELLVI
jgi:hypothetical protein